MRNKNLPTSYKELIETDVLDVKGNPKEILASLKVVATLGQKRAKYKKMFIRFLVSAVVLLIFGTTLISFVFKYLSIQNNIDFQPLIILIVIIILIIDVYYLVRFLMLFSKKSKTEVGEYVIPAIHKVLELFGDEGVLSVVIDLQSYQESEAYERKSSNTKYTLYKDVWFIGSYQPKSGSRVDWMIAATLLKIGSVIRNTEGDGSSILYKTRYDAVWGEDGVSETTVPNRIFWEDYRRQFDLPLFDSVLRNLRKANR